MGENIHAICQVYPIRQDSNRIKVDYNRKLVPNALKFLHEIEVEISKIKLLKSCASENVNHINFY